MESIKSSSKLDGARERDICQEGAGVEVACDREVPKLLLPLNIDPEKDVYTIKGGAGVAVAHVKKPNGDVFSARIRMGALRELTYYDPSRLSVDERRRLELDLHKNGYTQSEIADLVGVKQPTVAHDLKLMRQGNRP